MPVLIEAISVVISFVRAAWAYGGSVDAFVVDAPNRTLCHDGELARVGFMSPESVQDYVAALERRGLAYLSDGRAIDMVVVDQLKGPLATCDWIRFGRVNLDGRPDRKVAACWLSGSTSAQLICPVDWRYEGSLSESFGFVPEGMKDRSLRFLRRENGINIYLNTLSGAEVFIAEP